MKCVRKFRHPAMAEQVNIFLEKVNIGFSTKIRHGWWATKIPNSVNQLAWNHWPIRVDIVIEIAPYIRILYGQSNITSSYRQSVMSGGFARIIHLIHNIAINKLASFVLSLRYIKYHIYQESTIAYRPAWSFVWIYFLSGVARFVVFRHWLQRYDASLTEAYFQLAVFLKTP